MKLLLTVKDKKADFLMELLSYFPFVKVKKLTPKAARLLSEIKEAVDEMNLINAGKKKGRNVKEFLKELK